MSSDLPYTVLITGASGGIGSALAEAYAAANVSLLLQGRNRQRLQAVAAACAAKGAAVEIATLDLRDLPALETWLDEVCRRAAPNLLIVNAGLNTHVGRQGEAENWQAVQALLDVNVVAAIATVNAVLPAMRRRKTGQIALISSLAAYFGLPVTPSYCASKAALKAYGEALRGWLAAEGIKVNVVMPGYVESEMCRAMPGPKPFLWPAEKAAGYIKRGLRQNRARISFPFPLNFGAWWLAVLPPAVSQFILRRLHYAD
ncbi:MAG: SDR family NAD(P)-dependent oxidoreductase [Methylococcales bacterium]|nr:SDR family NAD(P)-dependent oxidoreductase [Methylococcales bacterium]